MSYSPPLSASQITEISQKITDLINTAITTATANAKALLNEQLEATVKTIEAAETTTIFSSAKILTQKKAKFSSAKCLA
jgi:hypothetical protein